MHRRIPVEARAPLPTESFEDQLVRKAQARHAKRRRDVHLTLYGGKPADLQTEIEQLSDEEDMHQKTASPLKQCLAILKLTTRENRSKG